MDTPAARPKVAVGFIHVGEPTVSSARDAILSQVGVDVTLLEVAHMPQLEAHTELYRQLDAVSESCALLAKVDGDMVIVAPRLFSAAIAVLDAFPDIQVLSIGVDDWFSGSRIDGMVIWRGGTRWLAAPEDWRPDKVRTTATRLVRIVHSERPMILHAVNPTPDQAIRYGIHRGIKAARTRDDSRIENAREFVRHTRSDPHPLRLLAVAGMLEGLTRPEESVRLMSSNESRHSLPELDTASRKGRLLGAVERELDSLSRGTARIRQGSSGRLTPARHTVAAVLDRIRVKPRGAKTTPPVDEGMDPYEALFDAALSVAEEGA